MVEKPSFKRVKRLAAVMATAGALAFTVLTPAEAAASSDFNPGRIIEDELFYDGQAMSAQQVQNFLNQQVPHGTPRSLRNYSQATTGKLPDAYCPGGYLGAGSETAAEIIAKVGRGCGISQKALLVMLQKEQSLITTVSPNDYAYQRAMGYACPDTGPNFGANCDASYFGFQNQVWHAARQLKRYRDSGQFTWFPVGGYANVQHHPNPSCGTQRIRIENHATAGLYYYTPYVPNSSVLAGRPDNCAAYGNYNFNKLYKKWFGDAVNISVDQSFRDLYNSNPGHYGKPVSGAVTVTGGVIEQRFEHATLFAAPGQQIAAVRGGIRNYYDLQGGSSSRFGVPRGNEYAENGTYRQHFSNAHAIWTPHTGTAFLVNGFKEAYLNQKNNLPTLLGAPYGVEEKVANGVQQRTQRGYMFWSPLTAVTWTRNGFAAEHKRLGGAAGQLGFPLNMEHQVGNHIVQHFEYGTAYYTPRTGAYAVAGDIHDMYQYQGGPNSTIGLPTGIESAVRGGTKQEFENATIYRTTDGTVGVVKNGIRAYFDRLGGPNGKLGLPLGVEIVSGDRVIQHFENGNVYWSPRNTVAVYGAFHGELMADEELAYQKYGYPLAEEQRIAGGWAQEFQQATAYWSPASGAGFLKGAFRYEYNRLGGTNSWLGFPVGAEVQTGEGYRQDFQHGTAYWTPQHGIIYVKGAIRGAHKENGAETGSFGWPLSAEINENGGWSQEFENGTVTWAPGIGIGFVQGDFRDFYLEAGGSGSWLGHPRGYEIRSAHGTRQEFRHATLFKQRSGEIVFVKGAIRSEFLRTGAENGRFGYPISSEESLGSDTYRQEFQKVVVTWTPAAGLEVQPK